MQKPGVLDFPSACIKLLMTILDEGISQLKSGFDIPLGLQLFLQNAFRLLYTLWSNSKTSEVGGRIAGSATNSSCVKYRRCPSRIKNRMTALLKCVEIEWKITDEFNYIFRMHNERLLYYRKANTFGSQDFSVLNGVQYELDLKMRQLKHLKTRHFFFCWTQVKYKT